MRNHGFAEFSPHTINGVSRHANREIDAAIVSVMSAHDLSMLV